MDEYLATDMEKEIADFILVNILSEQPQVFMVEDVLKQLYEKFGKEGAKYHLCNYVFEWLKRNEFITSFNGAVKLSSKGKTYKSLYDFFTNPNISSFHKWLMKKITGGLFT